MSENCTETSILWEERSRVSSKGYGQRKGGKDMGSNSDIVS